ncbi:MarR family winged helix-turn-helix transcriptional regulator [Bradyrhizobium roseum]|uniref:MarR family winged helix-turn-helix transcriptional regulator n=1 Tax=Bradyrhizobium roseum TaxID=3056648 RepID=UPI00263790F3|nr:MarR family transcriptional regulator [Bradyrhizobium roseus]WKA31353.1 MarR family transcriptional regulator [Bradyrhizobium roseus]
MSRSKPTAGRSKDNATATPPLRRVAKGRAAREQVDAIFSQWQTERLDIDTSPVHVYGLIGRIQMQCTAFIEEALEPFGLTRGTFDVLTALRRAGSPYCLSPKQIAQSLLLSGAGLTSRLNKLEAQNFLARLPEPNDRRTLRVQLTASGEVVINEAIPRVFEAQRRRLLPLGSDGQKRLVQELTRFAEVIDSWPSVPTAQPLRPKLV